MKSASSLFESWMRSSSKLAYRQRTWMVTITDTNFLEYERSLLKCCGNVIIMETPYIRISHDMIHSLASCHRYRQMPYDRRLWPTLATRSGIISNEGFSGIYDFKEERFNLPRLFDRFLQCPGSRMLIMCHPGRSDLELTQLDTLTTERDAELAFLLSDEWPHLLAKNGIQLGRLRRLDERLPSNSRRSSPMSTTS
jgi:hypothetical protein